MSAELRPMIRVFKWRNPRFDGSLVVVFWVARNSIAAGVTLLERLSNPVENVQRRKSWALSSLWLSVFSSAVAPHRAALLDVIEDPSNPQTAVGRYGNYLLVPVEVPLLTNSLIFTSQAFINSQLLHIDHLLFVKFRKFLRSLRYKNMLLLYKRILMTFGNKFILFVCKLFIIKYIDPTMFINSMYY